MIALTREPSCRRASTIGLDSSMRRPTALTMRSMICMQVPSSLNMMSVGFEPAVPLDVDLVEAVDQDVRDRRVARAATSSGPRPNSSCRTSVISALALVQAERRRVALAVEHAADQRADLRLGVLALDPRQPLEVEPVEQILMDAALQLLIVRRSGYRAAPLADR